MIPISILSLVILISFAFVFAILIKNIRTIRDIAEAEAIIRMKNDSTISNDMILQKLSENEEILNEVSKLLKEIQQKELDRGSWLD